MISKAELQKKFVECFKANRTSDGQNKAVSDFLGFAATNYYSLEKDAQELINGMLQGVEDHVRTVLPALTDSKMKRDLERKLKSIDKNFPSATSLIKGLAGPPKIDNPILKEGAAVFEMGLQVIMDLVQDALAGTHRGPESFAKMTLLITTVNELVVAHHLGQLGYMNQSYAHIRSVLEICDKIELFHKQPEWARKWVDDGQSRATQHELRPAGVREKLGQPKFDALYSALSSLGTHGTFEGIKLFSGKSANASGKPSIQVWIGGCYREDQVIFLHMLLHKASVAVLQSIWLVYKDKLHEEDTIERLSAFVAKAQEFMQNHLVPFAKAHHKDIAELESILAEQAQNLARINEWKQSGQGG